MIRATPAALQKIASLRKQLQMPDGLLKIGLQGGGCSGFIYLVEFTEDFTANDRMVIVDEDTEETVLIDKRAYMFLLEMEIDYAEDLVNGGFRFNIPDAKTCRCGMSFSPEG